MLAYIFYSLNIFLEFLSIIIFIRVILSWFMPDYKIRKNSFLQPFDAIYTIIVTPIRRIMPRTGVIDFSPLVALILVEATRILLGYSYPYIANFISNFS